MFAATWILQGRADRSGVRHTGRWKSLKTFGTFNIKDDAAEAVSGLEREYFQRAKELDLSMKHSGSNTEPGAALAAFLRKVCGLIGSEDIYLFQLDAAGTYSCTFGQNIDGRPLDTSRLKNLSGENLSAWVTAFYAENGYLISDMEAYAKAYPQLGKMFLRIGIRNMMLAPVYLEGRYIGYLASYNTDLPSPGMAMELLCSAANHVAMLMHLETSWGQIADMKRYDQVTGLYSRTVFQESLSRFLVALRTGMREGKWDLVGFNNQSFKSYNGRYGFEAGNDLLRKTADVIHRVTGGDFVTRTSGDRFYLFIEDDRAEESIEKIRAIMKSGGEDSVELFAGIYTITGGEAESGLVMERAKLATDAARDNMDGYVCRFDISMEMRVRMEDYLVSHVDEAVDKGWIKVYYQPIYSTVSGKINANEALARWDDPVYGFLNPAQFIDVLEKHHIIYKVDLFVLRHVCEMIKQKVMQGESICRASVNLSRYDLELPDLHERINAIVDGCGIPHDALHFEITESALLDNEDIMEKHIELFHRDGYEVWLDDFGSGFSSLNVLQKFDFDCIKIDMLFLHHGNDRTPAIMRSIVQLAKKLGMLTLTEGVETKEQLEFLREIGCTFAQGYYFSKPELPENLRKIEKIAHVGRETARETIFYRRVARVDVLDPENPIQQGKSLEMVPAAIFRTDGGSGEFIYANTAFRTFLETASSYSWEAIRTESPLWNEKFGRIIQGSARKARHSGKQVVYDFILPTVSGKLIVDFVTEYMGQCAWYMRVLNVAAHVKQPLNKQDYLPDIYSLFDLAGEIIPGEGRFLHIYGEMNDSWQTEHRLLVSAEENFAREFIYPSEVEEYMALMEPSTLLERVSKAPGQVINAFFHIRGMDGKYHWRRLILAQITAGGKARCFYGILRNTVGWSAERLRSLSGKDKRPADIAAGYFGDHALYTGEIWSVLFSQKKLGFFWMDTEQRFIGANETFLRYCGLSRDDIVGRRAEELGWTKALGAGADTGGKNFRKEESGGQIGEFVIHGKVRRIMYSWMPVCSQEQIVGLAGYFVDITDALSAMDAADLRENKDPLTELLNFNGIFEAAKKMEENYRENGEDFALISLHIGSIGRFMENFGAERCASLLRLAGQKIRENAPSGSIVGHVAGSFFDVLVPASDPETLEEHQKMIAAAVSEIRTVGGDTPVTLQVKTGSALCSKYGNISDMIDAALRHMDQEYVQMKTLRELRELRRAYEEKIRESDEILRKNQVLMIENRLIKGEADIDPLTHALNRRGIEEAGASLSPSEKVVLVFLDVNNFEIFNNLYGHDIGDALLVDLAGKLKKVVRNYGIIARAGSDVFEILFWRPDSIGLQEMQEFFAKDHSFRKDGKEFTYTVSAGYAVFPEQTGKFQELTRMADAALYHAKLKESRKLYKYEEGMKRDPRGRLGFSLKDFSNDVPIAIFVYQAQESEQILYANLRCADVFGCDSVDSFIHLVGGSFRGLVHPDDIDRVEKEIRGQINDPASGNLNHVTYRIIRRDGAVRNIMAVGGLVHHKVYGDIFYMGIVDLGYFETRKQS